MNKIKKKYDLKKIADKMICPHCFWKWDSRSKRLMIKCPSCQKFFRNIITYNEITRQKESIL